MVVGGAAHVGTEKWSAWVACFVELTVRVKSIGVPQTKLDDVAKA